MMKLYSFEKLEVYKSARELNKQVYKLAKRLPDAEKFGLQSQLKRACISVSLNIAEGSSRWSIKEKIRYIEIAYGSAIEVLSAIQICVDVELLPNEAEDYIRQFIEPITMKLSAWKNAIDNNIAKEDSEPYETL